MGWAKYNEDNANLFRERNVGRVAFEDMGMGGALFLQTGLGGEDWYPHPKRTWSGRVYPPVEELRPRWP